MTEQWVVDQATGTSNQLNKLEKRIERLEKTVDETWALLWDLLEEMRDDP